MKLFNLSIEHSKNNYLFITTPHRTIYIEHRAKQGTPTDWIEYGGGEKSRLTRRFFINIAVRHDNGKEGFGASSGDPITNH